MKSLEIQYQGFQLWQIWEPGPRRRAGWSISDLGPQQEMLIISWREGEWRISHPVLGFHPNEEGDGYLPIEPDRQSYPLVHALYNKSFATRYQALEAIRQKVYELEGHQRENWIAEQL